MDETFTIRAIVLDRQPYRENDSRVPVYSLEQGKLSLIARGTASVKSKMAGHIEPFCFSDIMVVCGRNRDYIGGAAVKNSFAKLKSDLAKLSVAGSACSFLASAVKDSEPDPNLFHLLLDFLEFLEENKISGEREGLLVGAFAFKTAAILGYLPVLSVCTVCGKKIEPQGNGFECGRGGLACPLCKSKDSIPISGGAIKILRYLIKESFLNINKLRLDRRVSDESALIRDSYLAFLFGTAKK